MAVRALSQTSSWNSTSNASREAAIQEVYASLTVPGPGVRLLAFDDGGIRGLTMLLLLRKIFLRIQQASCLPAMPLPCEYFDIIGGSGTGGFIALLLGRLRLSIENAIECYGRLVRQVFAQIKGDGSFRASHLEKVVKEISRRYGDGQDTPLFDTQPSVCKTFVCVREDAGSGDIASRRLRTYAHPVDPTMQCTLMEAVRATMGNSTFFKPICVRRGDSTITLLDAGESHYNPVFDVLEEAELIYPARYIAYYLSLGAGTVSTVGENSSRIFSTQPRLPMPTLTAVRHLAHCCDSTAASFEEHHRDLGRKYVRVTPNQPLRDGRIPWEEAEDLDALVTPYLDTVQQQTLRGQDAPGIHDVRYMYSKLRQYDKAVIESTVAGHQAGFLTKLAYHRGAGIPRRNHVFTSWNKPSSFLSTHTIDRYYLAATMAFLTSPEISFSDKVKRVIQAPFRTPSGLGREWLNDLEHGRNMDPPFGSAKPSSSSRNKDASPENIPGSARTSMSAEDADFVPPVASIFLHPGVIAYTGQTYWQVGGQKFVHQLADEDDAWNAGTRLVDHYDSTACRVARENIDTLLVFAGLFSGVATAFIIESYRWLLLEPDDMSAEYLRRILEVLSNSTVPAISQSSGRPSLPDDIVALINGLWFSSLTLSLSSALIGIVSKQWLHEYLRDAGRSQMTNLSVRQVKYQGLSRWYVDTIIALIPLFLQGALFLFLAGVVYLLWHIQPVIAAVVSALALSIAVFFIMTTVLPAIQFLLGWAEILRLHRTNQFPFKSAQALIFLRLSIIIGNTVAWIYHYFISMKGVRFGYSFEAPFRTYSGWPQLDLDWTRLRDHYARQSDEPTSLGLCVGFMELNFEHRLLRNWIWGCLWSLRDNAADAKYVLQCIRRAPETKSDFPTSEDYLAKEVLPLFPERLAPQVTTELVMLSLLGPGNKGPHVEARIEHLIRLFNSLIHRDVEEIPLIVYYTLRATLIHVPKKSLDSDTRCQLVDVAQSILRKDRHAEDLYGSSFLDLITTIVTCLSEVEVPIDDDGAGALKSDRDLSLDLAGDMMDWLERYPDPSSNWEDYKSRVIWSAHITVLFARILTGFKSIEPENIQVNHSRFPVIYELSQFVFEKARPIPSDVLPTWAPDKSDMEEFARVKVAIEEAAQACPSLAAPSQVRRTTDGTRRHGVHWEDVRARNGSAPTETASQPTDSDATNIIPVAGGARSGSMSPEGTLTEQTASASGSLGSQGRGNDEGVVYEDSEGAVKGEVH